eukprot:1148597-Pelagomonas_calceolata.AAC.18
MERSLRSIDRVSLANKQRGRKLFMDMERSMLRHLTFCRQEPQDRRKQRNGGATDKYINKQASKQWPRSHNLLTHHKVSLLKLDAFSCTAPLSGMPLFKPFCMRHRDAAMRIQRASKWPSLDGHSKAIALQSSETLRLEHCYWK